MSHYPLPDPFVGIAISQDKLTEVVHEIAEICLFTSFLDGVLDRRGRYIMDKAKVQLQRLLQLPSPQELEPRLLKQINDEASNLARVVKDARLIELTYLENGDKKKAYLPVSKFSPSVKRKIFECLAQPAKQGLEEVQQMKERLTYYERVVRYHKEILDDLSRRLGVRETVDLSSEVPRIKADLEDARQKYGDLKRRYEAADESVAETLFRKVKLAQEKVNQLVREIQALEQKGRPPGNYE